MAKKKKDEGGESTSTYESAGAERAPEPTPSPRPASRPVTKSAKQTPGLLTITAYLSLKKVPERRRAGMKAFTKLTRATFEEWESAFKSY